MTENQETLKPRVEVVEESQETLDVLDLYRLPRREKMAREQRALDGAHEVRFAERSFIPRRIENIEEIRGAVDALVPKRAQFPEARPAAPLPPPPEPEPAPPEIPEEIRAALDPVVGGKLVAADIVHRDEAGQLVEATTEGADGARSKKLYAIVDGVARPFDDIGARIDALPTPTVPRPEPEPARAVPVEGAPEPTSEPAPAPTAAPEPTTEKKGRFGRFGRKKDETPKPDTAPDASPAPAPEPSEKKGMLGRFSRKKEPDAAPAPAESPPPAAEDTPPKRRFGLGRKKN